MQNDYIYFYSIGKGWRHDKYNEPEEKNLRSSPKYGSD
jgi:hypothetical protein